MVFQDKLENSSTQTKPNNWQAFMARKESYISEFQTIAVKLNEHHN